MKLGRHNSFAYGLLAPALIVMTLCGVIPLGFVVFYSLHDSFAGNNFVWAGLTWFRQVLSSPDFYGALARSLGFSLLVLAIEIPLGLYVALRLPTKGLLSSLYIVLMAIPVLMPTIVVGYIWQVLTLPRVGLLTAAAAGLGLDLDLSHPLVAWLILALMDSWHWTSFVVLLCFAGLRAIPDDYYRAATIDGASAWAVFRHIQLPKLRFALLLAILLRFMDSFVIYAEAYVVTRGGPGVSTTFLSHELVQTATVQFDLGEGGAISVIYFLIVICVSWVFFTLMVPRRPATAKAEAA